MLARSLLEDGQRIGAAECPVARFFDLGFQFLVKGLHDLGGGDVSGVGDVQDRFVCLLVRYSFIRVDEICADQNGSVKVCRGDVGCISEPEGPGYVGIMPDGKDKTAALLDVTDTLQQRLSGINNLIVWKMIGIVVQRYQPAVSTMSDARQGRRASGFAHKISDGILLRVEPDLRVKLGEESLGILCVGKIRVHGLAEIAEFCLGNPLGAADDSIGLKWVTRAVRDMGCRNSFTPLVTVPECFPLVKFVPAIQRRQWAMPSADGLQCQLCRFLPGSSFLAGDEGCYLPSDSGDRRR